MYLLLVVNYQSWVDPLIILMAVPGALTGIVWSLFVTQSTFSVPALMGAVMTIGVASANSILMVTFCNEQIRAGKSSIEAASTAGFQRFRPVCMTAIAMILGMIPMAHRHWTKCGDRALGNRWLVCCHVFNIIFCAVNLQCAGGKTQVQNRTVYRRNR